ncbi:uncharacterized protein FYDLN [Litorimonas taeanensis]|uniref:Uncharacterized protein FYDLN n=1 Tax=Litorimonas taeanensis TaxID=568099 RepID=A0A420WF81_9PROT|nr:FYDLN acid domain-containing protein [Litorimonas taeanensis]RKQ69637.1 uncharacterized protein FYDLN [Litorimonas taeanensis]
MAKKVDLGTKRVCPECEAKFYDLGKDPALCPMCGTETAWDQFNVVPILPSSQLPPEPKDDDDDDEDEDAKAEIDEDDIDEEEEAAKELELDGDDVQVIGGAKGGDDEQPGYDGYSEDEDEDEDAALVADDDDNEMPPPDDADDLDDDEEIEI